VKPMSNTFKNAVPTTLGDGTLVRTGAHGLDVMWTKFRVAGEYEYVMRTWEPCWMDTFTMGDTRDSVRVVRIAPKNWAVKLYGEIVSEGYEWKGNAQSAAEALVLA
jgi:hypothetical protein